MLIIASFYFKIAVLSDVRPLIFPPNKLWNDDKERDTYCHFGVKN